MQIRMTMVKRVSSCCFSSFIVFFITRVIAINTHAIKNITPTMKVIMTMIMMLSSVLLSQLTGIGDTSSLTDMLEVLMALSAEDVCFKVEKIMFYPIFEQVNHNVHQ